MDRCKVYPCVFRKMENNDMVLITVVYVGDLLASGNETVCKELLDVLNGQFSTENFGGLEWYIGRAVERDWKKGTKTISQRAMFDTLLASFDAKHSSNIPASAVAKLGPTAYDNVDELFNDWGGRGYDYSVPGDVTKTAPSGDGTT